MSAHKHFQAFLELFRIPADKPQLVVAQFHAFSWQLPLMYGMLLLNTGFLAFTHAGTAPAFLTTYIPLVLSAACAARVFMWWRSRHAEVTPERATAELKRTVVLSAVLGFVFMGWSLSLYPYGDAYQQAHVAFYMAITVIACIFCLMQLRAAALTVVAVVIGPYVATFAMSGHPVFVAIAFNLLFVCVAMVTVLHAHYRTFCGLVEAEQSLKLQNEEARRLSDANYELANMDALTGLPNRRCFFAVLDDQIAAFRKSGQTFALGLIDLDGFKPVNDLYGHSAGDRVLSETARRLNDICGASIFVARLGGDEFALVVGGSLCAEELKATGERICTALRQPFDSLGAVVQISGSVGFAICEHASDSSVQLYDKADYALYYAKQNLRGAAIVFSQTHELELRDLTRVEQTLRQADLEAEMTVMFQPITDVARGRIRGFEALARWESAALGKVPPGLFIRAAERSGMIARLTPILLRKTLAVAHQLPDDVDITFNLSAQDICSPETIVRILALIASSGVAPSRLEFEITETAIMADFDQACHALKLLRNLGARIALDDFGSGYANLAHVHRLPLDAIKIDREFIQDIETNDISRSIVRSVADLIRNLGVGSVVEGVENEKQIAILREIGFNVMQGYYFGAPMPVEEAAAHALRQLEAA